MDPLIALLIALRIMHIVAGVFLVGIFFFLTMLLEPRLRAMGPVFQRNVMLGMTPSIMNSIMWSGMVVGVTGIAMILILRRGNLETLFATGWGWAILVSTVATLAALAVRLIFMPMVRGEEELAGSSGTKMNRKLSSRLNALSLTSLVLILINVAAMAAARFM